MPRYNCLAADNVPLIERAMPHAKICMRHQRDVAKLFIPAFAEYAAYCSYGIT